MIHPDSETNAADAHVDADRRLDDELRRALEPPPGAAERVARRALERPTRPRRRSPRLRPQMALATLCALLVVAVCVPLIPRLDAPDAVPDTAPDAAPAPRPHAERPAAAESPPDGLSLSNLDGPVVLTTADGTRWIALPSNPPTETSSDGG